MGPKGLRVRVQVISFDIGYIASLSCELQGLTGRIGPAGEKGYLVNGRGVVD